MKVCYNCGHKETTIERMKAIAEYSFGNIEYQTDQLADAIMELDERLKKLEKKKRK